MLSHYRVSDKIFFPNPFPQVPAFCYGGIPGMHGKPGCPGVPARDGRDGRERAKDEQGSQGKTEPQGP